MSRAIANIERHSITWPYCCVARQAHHVLSPGKRKVGHRFMTHRLNNIHGNYGKWITRVRLLAPDHKVFRPNAQRRRAVRNIAADRNRESAVRASFDLKRSAFNRTRKEVHPRAANERRHELID